MIQGERDAAWQRTAVDIQPHTKDYNIGQLTLSPQQAQCSRFTTTVGVEMALSTHSSHGEVRLRLGIVSPINTASER